MSADVRMLMDRLAIADLTTRYNQLLDAVQVDEFLELWTETPEFRVETGVDPLVVKGRDALRTFVLANAPNGVHLTVNAIAEVVGDSARQQCRVILGVRSPGREPGSARWVATGAYEDELVRTGAGWRFATRRFRADAELAPHEEADG